MPASTNALRHPASGTPLARVAETMRASSPAVGQVLAIHDENLTIAPRSRTDLVPVRPGSLSGSLGRAFRNMGGSRTLASG
jgi:hypothetical protein